MEFLIEALPYPMNPLEFTGFLGEVGQHLIESDGVPLLKQ